MYVNLSEFFLSNHEPPVDDIDELGNPRYLMIYLLANRPV